MIKESLKQFQSFASNQTIYDWIAIVTTVAFVIFCSIVSYDATTPDPVRTHPDPYNIYK